MLVRGEIMINKKIEIMNHISLDSLFLNKNIKIMAFLTEEEIYGSKHSDSSTIINVMNGIKKMNGNISYISYRDLGFTGKIINIFWNIKNKKGFYEISGSTLRWVLTPIFYVFIRYFSILDFTFKSSLKNIFNESQDILIIFYPYLYIPISKKFPKDKKLKLILYELNIEKKFFEFHLSDFKYKKIANLLLKIIEKIENEVILKSEIILSCSKRDENFIKKYYPEKQTFLFYPIKFYSQEHINRLDILKIKDVLRNKDFKLSKDKFIITFIGSNYSLNVISIKKLINLNNNKISEKINFIIIGNVSDYFKSENNLPENFIFTGFIQNINEIMVFSDYFILFDFMETGIETKFVEYAKYFKPIIIVTKDVETYRKVIGERLISFSDENELEKFLENLDKNKH
jgi:hypothetical protein